MSRARPCQRTETDRPAPSLRRGRRATRWKERIGAEGGQRPAFEHLDSGGSFISMNRLERGQSTTGAPDGPPVRVRRGRTSVRCTSRTSGARSPRIGATSTGPLCGTGKASIGKAHAAGEIDERSAPWRRKVRSEGCSARCTVVPTPRSRAMRAGANSVGVSRVDAYAARARTRGPGLASPRRLELAFHRRSQSNGRARRVEPSDLVEDESARYRGARGRIPVLSVFVTSPMADVPKASSSAAACSMAAGVVFRSLGGADAHQEVDPRNEAAAPGDLPRSAESSTWA